jgi:GGDEF domain-containing protein
LPGPGRQALSGVVWAALREELRAPSPDLVTGLAERLALVCSVIRDGAIEGPLGGGLEAVRSQPADAGPAESRRCVPDLAPGPAPAAANEVADVVDVTEAGAPSEPLWLSALGDEVRGSGSGGRPLSLLLAELEDADRVLASTSPERAGMAFGDFVAALRRVLREQDILVCEEDARAWVIARETARAGAHSLGARIAEAVGETSTLNGVPLVASVGVAVLGEDGESPDELIEAAEEARFSASARGIEVSRRVPDRDRG